MRLKRYFVKKPKIGILIFAPLTTNIYIPAFPKMFSGFLKVFSAFPKMFSGFLKVFSAFLKSISGFLKMFSGFLKSISALLKKFSVLLKMFPAFLKKYLGVPEKVLTLPENVLSPPEKYPRHKHLYPRHELRSYQLLLKNNLIKENSASGKRASLRLNFYFSLIKNFSKQTWP